MTGQIVWMHRLIWVFIRRSGWSGMAKVCILHYRSVQLILAYSRVRPAIFVAGNGRGGNVFYFFRFYTFIAVPLSSLSLSFISSTIFSISFSLSLGDDTKWPTRVDMSLDPNTINQCSKVLFLSCGSYCIQNWHYENTPIQIRCILKFLQPKKENFQIKTSDTFSYFCSEHRLWVLVRTTSARQF